MYDVTDVRDLSLYDAFRTFPAHYLNKKLEKLETSPVFFGVLPVDSAFAISRVPSATDE